VLADEELDTNANLFAAQAFRILDPDKTEVRFNGEWLAKLSFAEVVSPHAHAHRLAPPRAATTREALRCAGPISLSELLYPPMQAYDSVAIDADVEIAAPTSSTTCLPAAT